MTPEQKATAKKKIWLCILIVILSLSVFRPQADAAEQSAGGVIKAFNDTLLEAMKKAGELKYSGRYRLLEPVIKDTFALSFMASQSVGRYWKTLTEEQRRTFLKTYTEWSIATYAGRFDDYSGERFEVVSESAPSQGTVTVTSTLTKSDGEEVVFSYLMRKIGGKWRVADIQVAGVSQLAMTRSQFTRIVQEKGIDGLLASLQEKINGFSKGKEK